MALPTQHLYNSGRVGYCWSKGSVFPSSELKVLGDINRAPYQYPYNVLVLHFYWLKEGQLQRGRNVGYGTDITVNNSAWNADKKEKSVKTASPLPVLQTSYHLFWVYLGDL